MPRGPRQIRRRGGNRKEALQHALFEAGGDKKKAQEILQAATNAAMTPAARKMAKKYIGKDNKNISVDKIAENVMNDENILKEFAGQLPDDFPDVPDVMKEFCHYCLDLRVCNLEINNAKFCSEVCQNLYEDANQKIEEMMADAETKKCCHPDCDNGGINKCGRCLITLYCSKTCQSNDWVRHRKVCKTYLAIKGKGENLAKLKANRDKDNSDMDTNSEDDDFLDSIL